jgi:hypothetical protein
VGVRVLGLSLLRWMAQAHSQDCPPDR